MNCEDLQVGDKVMARARGGFGSRGDGCAIVVERIMPTQIIANGLKFRKSDGAGVGNSDEIWEQWEIVRARQLEEKIHRHVEPLWASNRKHRRLTLDQLERMAAIVDETDE